MRWVRMLTDRRVQVPPPFALPAVAFLSLMSSFCCLASRRASNDVLSRYKQSLDAQRCLPDPSCLPPSKRRFVGDESPSKSEKFWTSCGRLLESLDVTVGGDERSLSDDGRCIDCRLHDAFKGLDCVGFCVVVSLRAVPNVPLSPVFLGNGRRRSSK